MIAVMEYSGGEEKDLAEDLSYWKKESIGRRKILENKTSKNVMGD